MCTDQSILDQILPLNVSFSIFAQFCSALVRARNAYSIGFPSCRIYLQEEFLIWVKINEQRGLCNRLLHFNECFLTFGGPVPVHIFFWLAVVSAVTHWQDLGGICINTGSFRSLSLLRVRQWELAC